MSILNLSALVDKFTLDNPRTIEPGGAEAKVSVLALALVQPRGGSSARLQIFDSESQACRDIAAEDLPALLGTGLTLPVVDYGANGAITPISGVIALTKAGVNAMTLANPTAAQEGIVMHITAETAQAHTVTVTGGFAGNAGEDVATFGGAIGDNMVVRAHNLLWHVVSLRNVTLA